MEDKLNKLLKEVLDDDFFIAQAKHCRFGNLAYFSDKLMTHVKKQLVMKFDYYVKK